FTQANQVISSEEGGTTTGVWNDRVQTELPRGRYTVLAFANMDNAKLKDLFKEGQPLPEDWKNIITSQSSYNQEQPLIPMSGYREINVTQTVNETFSIEVVRMLAKVQFAFKNESQTPVSIEKIEFQPVYDGDIYLFPEEGNGDSRFVEGAYPNPQNYGMRTIAPALSLPNFNDTARSTFYIKESAAKGNHPTDHFHIGISLKRNGETENATYALASDELQTILRNDYVLFPVVISDYIPRLEVYDYPPIGGYPVQVESNGNEFYATFSSSGAFDIEAKLVNSAGETVVVSEKRNDTDTEYVECIISDQLQKELSLTYDPIEEMWHGDFKKGANPNAPIILTFKFHIGNLIYTRSLHLLSTKMNGNN
ncbi:MAG: FimB/Mfa2 family fimbrial subunit, partial [Muribaculaceae bacterium]|nr:FimB/Mfa2 family fimbrial subunit [Muribaculaceae bacterium]